MAAALIAGALGAGAGTAQAAPVQDDFGTAGGGTAAVGGAVEIAAFGEDFDAAPAGWTSTPWATGIPAPFDGAMPVDDELVHSATLGGAGRSLEFTATFGTQKFQHLGFATTLSASPWAIFSTGNGSSASGNVYARTRCSACGTAGEKEFPAHAADGQPHTYRIDWTTTGVAFYVDGAKVTIPDADLAVITSDMQPLVSDSGTGAVSVDSMTLRTATSGTYTSKVFDAGDSRVSGIAFTHEQDTANGTIAYETRTSADNATWTGWGAENATQPARYFQYRATLSAPSLGLTPRLKKATVDFAIDSTAPAVTIGSIGVSGSTARVPFSSNDAGATYQCSLDGGAFATCSSPAEFGSLAPGAHTVVVRGTDGYGNAGTATQQFTVASTVPGGGTGTDTSKPKLGLPRDADVSRGKARFLFACPTSEQVCSVSLKLKYKGKTIAAKARKIAGGDSAYVAAKLSRAAKQKLAKSDKLRVVAKLTVTDAAGNVGKASRTIWLYPA